MPQRPTLNVFLTPELVDYVGGRVRSGRYRSASEVVRAAFRRMQREGPAAACPARGEAQRTQQEATSDE